MNSTADVAVVMPAYNAERTLASALASIAGQSVLPSSVVVVDDGSSDGTARMANDWRGHLPLQVLHQDRSGPGAARRLAVASTDEPLIALLDADDVWLPDHLETLLAVHMRTPGIITADALPWSTGRSLGPETYQSAIPVPAVDLQPTRILHSNFVFIGSLFARIDYEAAGGFRPLGAEDWDLWIRMIRLGLRVHTPTHPTYIYRQSPTGLTAQPNILDQYLEVLEAALREAGSDEERQEAAWGLRMCGARQALREAYSAAAKGDTGTARRAAVRGLRGARLDRLQSLALAASPQLALRLRGRLRR